MEHCSHHMTPDEINRKDTRTADEKRMNFSLGQQVATNSRYSATMGHPNPLDGGHIVKFRDPYEWEKGTSVALIALPCGCKGWLNVFWLKEM